MTTQTKTVKPTRTVFQCSAPAAQAIFLAGDFNDWSATAHAMKRAAEGTWELAIELPPGRHQFKFVVDGEWCCEPGPGANEHTCHECVPNPFGTMNRVVDV